MSAEIAPARAAAVEVLRRTFEHDAFADRALASAIERHGLDRRERSQAHRLAYGAVQRRGTSDHLIEVMSGRSADALDGAVAAALRLGLYELLFADATPDYAAVDQAVELAKRSQRGERGAGFVNALLRRAAREGAQLVAGLDDSTPEGAAIAHSYPEWLARMWWSEHGPKGARSLMIAMNEPAETAFRVNTLRTDPQHLADELRAADERLDGPRAAGPLWPPEALVSEGPLGVALVDQIARGALIPQSRASQAVVALLDPHPGERVLDLCAGPGVKTTAIAAQMEDRGEILSVEIDPGRAAQVGDLCGRAGVTCVRVEVADAAKADLGSGYDRILVDPPCSDLGTLASRPDARWRKSEADVKRLAELQLAIAERALHALAPAGTLVYSTCTISARENEAVVARALPAADDLGAEHPELASDRDGRFLQLRPDRDGTDGFFIARTVAA
ncbi:MAG TPA: transcription antitermination factor NusB [Solirubrobacterales bacterium]|nr:transcription antitermination factor NusB [Solirubrobacterales bacterium]